MRDTIVSQWSYDGPPRTNKILTAESEEEEEEDRISKSLQPSADVGI